MRLGFVGLGQMGRPIAHNLLKSGAELIVSDRTDRWFWEFRDKGVTATTNAADLAETDILFLCLPNTEVVQSFLLGESGVIARLRQGQTVVDLSTIGYNATVEIGRALEAEERRLLGRADLRHGGAGHRRHAHGHVRRRARGVRAREALLRLHRQQDPLHGAGRQRAAHQAHQPAPVRHQRRRARRNPAHGGEDGARPRSGRRGGQQRHRPQLRVGVLHSSHSTGHFADGYPMATPTRTWSAAPSSGPSAASPCPCWRPPRRPTRRPCCEGTARRTRAEWSAVFEELLGVQFRSGTDRV